MLTSRMSGRLEVPTIGLKLVVGDGADRVLGELALVVVRRGSSGR